MKKRNKILTVNVQGLIVAILAIMAFVRGNVRDWLLLAAFVIFAAVSIYAFAAARMERQKYVRRPAKKMPRQPQAQAPAFEIPSLDGPSDSVLLQHVNHRISSYLKSTYPDTKWEWISADPVNAVLQGGEGRIKLFGVEDFNEAMVTFGDNARINFHMMRVVPLSVVQGKETEGKDRVPASLPVDVGVWYDASGKAILADLVADLASRGFSKLIIRENGDVCVTQDNEEVVQDTLFNMPAEVHWPLLAKVLAKNGLAATVEDTGIVVGW